MWFMWRHSYKWTPMGWTPQIDIGAKLQHTNPLCICIFAIWGARRVHRAVHVLRISFVCELIVLAVKYIYIYCVRRCMVTGCCAVNGHTRIKTNYSRSLTHLTQATHNAIHILNPIYTKAATPCCCAHYPQEMYIE